MIKSLILGAFFLFAARPEKINVITYAAIVQYCVVTDLKPIERFPAVPGLDGPLDSVYGLPSQLQIEKIHRAVQEHKPIYQPEAYDCDDIALEYYVRARKFAREKFPSGNSALAVAVLFVKIEGPILDLGIDWKLNRPAYHALNAYLRSDGNWILIEPQNSKMVLWKSVLYEGNLEVMKIII